MKGQSTPTAPTFCPGIWCQVPESVLLFEEGAGHIEVIVTSVKGALTPKDPGVMFGSFSFLGFRVATATDKITRRRGLRSMILLQNRIFSFRNLRTLHRPQLIKSFKIRNRCICQIQYIFRIFSNLFFNHGSKIVSSQKLREGTGDGGYEWSKGGER